MQHQPTSWQHEANHDDRPQSSEHSIAGGYRREANKVLAGFAHERECKVPNQAGRMTALIVR